jgi:hypothetical protein
VTRNQRQLKASKLASTLRPGQQRNFWDEVNRIKRKGSPTVRCVDGIVGDAELCEHFGQQYKELYNCVSFCPNQMAELLSDLDEAINSSCHQGSCFSNHSVSALDVQKAISRLKPGKCDCKEGLSSDHFLNSCGQLSVHLSLLLSMMLRHSFVPKLMMDSTLVPIPKNARKSLNRSDNYRSIAISSLIGKILDNIILTKHDSILCNSELQFGFRPNHSTTQCTFVLHEVIDFYQQQGTPTLVCLLDASKAFDRVHYVKLFRLLLERNFCPLTAKLLLFSYTNQCMHVRWAHLKSAPFKCSNGVKQGAVLSPVLFCVYMDKLLSLLKLSNVGCHLGRRFAGALSYADDLALIAPTVHAARKLLLICESFATEYNVLFNSTKSTSILFGSMRDVCTDLFIHGQVIPRSTSAVHLGTHIGANSHSANMQKAKRDLCTRVNSLVHNFGFCTYDVKCMLFNSFCNSFYGCPLWNLSAMNELSITWRKCVRRLLRLPPRTHSRFVAPLVKQRTICTQLYARFLVFFKKAFSSMNPLVKCSALLASTSSQSHAAENARSIFSSCNVNPDMFFINPDCAYFDPPTEHPFDDEDTAVLGAIIELIECRDGVSGSILSDTEIIQLLYSLCVN